MALLLLVVLVLVLTPGPVRARTTREWCILAHLDGRGGLQPAAEKYIAGLQAAASAGADIAVEYVRPATSTGGAVVERWLATPARVGKRVVVGKLADGETGAAALCTFVTWADRQLPAKHRALLVMGHGVGLPDTSTAATAHVRPLQLRRALAEAAGRDGPPIDVIGLDTCFGGSLEVAYELRGLCRYLTAAPGLIYTPGLDWGGAVRALVRSQSPTPANLVKDLVRRGMGPATKPPAVLIGMDMSRLDPVVAGVRSLASALRRGLAENAPIVALDRGQAQSWGERDELCDLGELAHGLARDAPQEAVRVAATQLLTALGKFIIARWQAGAEAGQQGNPERGLGLYFPATLEQVPAAYADNFQMAADTGWTTFLEAYWGRIEGMLSRTPG